MKQRAGPDLAFRHRAECRWQDSPIRVGSAILTTTLLLLSLVAEGCGHRHPTTRRTPSPTPTKRRPTPPATSRAPQTPPAVPGSYVEEGFASWYGIPYHGRRTASGEVYDMYSMTAAHRTMAFHSVVRVTNLQNGRKTEVRINDRGPFIEDRIIDLSLAAARELDLVAAGIARVRLELLAGPSPLAGYFTVQVGAFLVRANAERLRERLRQRYSPIFIHEYDSPGGLFYRVRVGRVSSEPEARLLAQQLETQESVSSFVVRLDEPDLGSDPQTVPQRRQTHE